MSKIFVKNLPLVRAFVEREANDYTPAKDLEWIAAMEKKIERSLAQVDASEVRFISLSNIGLISRSLMIPVVRSEVAKSGDLVWAERNYDFIFCACGCVKDSSLQKRV